MIQLIHEPCTVPAQQRKANARHIQQLLNKRPVNESSRFVGCTGGTFNSEAVGNAFGVVSSGNVQRRKYTITKGTLIDFYSSWFRLDASNHWAAIIN